MRKETNININNKNKKRLKYYNKAKISKQKFLKINIPSVSDPKITYKLSNILNI